MPSLDHSVRLEHELTFLSFYDLAHVDGGNGSNVIVFIRLVHGDSDRYHRADLLGDRPF